MELLLSEPEILIDETQRKIEMMINIYDGNFEEKQDEFYKKCSEYQQQLEERQQRSRKCF